MGHTTTRRSLLIGVMLGSLVAGCQRRQGPLEEDTELSAHMRRLHETRETARVKDLTGGDWDTVYVFHQNVSRQYVERTVGDRVDMEEFCERGDVWVFIAAGTVTRSVYTKPWYLADGVYSDRVELRPVDKTELDQLQLVEPVGTPTRVVRNGSSRDR